MRIAMLLPGGVDRSGVDRVVPAILWLIERLARRHDVHVFALHQEGAPGTWELLGARVHDAGTIDRWPRRLFTDFSAAHRATPFDVLHAFFGWCGTYAALLGWRHHVPVVYHAAGEEPVAFHDIGYGMGRTAAGRLALRVASAGARRVTVATPFMQRLAAERGIRARLVPLGVALDRWPVAEPRPRDWRRPARLLHIGDVRPVKDQLTLFDALARLRDAGIALELDVVGHDTTHGGFRGSPTARMLDGITRWHGVLRRDALRALVERADLLLVSSRHEAGPLVVLEAAVAGVPTVGTAVGHVAEWAPHAAVAVPVGDAVALADATAALLADDARRLAIAHAAQRRAIAIDADHTAAAFESIYAEIRRDSRSPVDRQVARVNEPPPWSSPRRTR